MKKHLSTALYVCMFFVGLSVLLYPAVSDHWNSKVQSKVITNYESMLSEMSSEDYTSCFENADEYNEQLRKISYPLINYEKVDGYNDMLNVDGSGVFGYLDIDKIKLELPIYHGISPDVLNVAAGHLPGSSLPVGGESTHCVISAHRGLPSAKLFTDLDKLEIGDTFTITVLDRILTYQIDQILIVKPEEVDALAITAGEDYCTLVTCTPYGINTHRLLVRGTRVENIEPKTKIFVPNEGIIIDPLVVAPVVAAPMLLILFVVIMVKYRPNKNKRRK